jgi:hypothetical protein
MQGQNNLFGFFHVLLNGHAHGGQAWCGCMHVKSESGAFNGIGCGAPKSGNARGVLLEIRKVFKQ